MKPFLVLPALCLAFALTAHAQQTTADKVKACNIVTPEEASGALGYPFLKFSPGSPDRRTGQGYAISYCDLYFDRGDKAESETTFRYEVYDSEAGAQAEFAEVRELKANSEPSARFTLKLSAEISGLGDEAIVLEQTSNERAPEKWMGYILYWRHGTVVSNLQVTDQHDWLVVDPDKLIALAKVIDAKGVTTVNLTE